MESVFRIFLMIVITLLVALSSMIIITLGLASLASLLKNARFWEISNISLWRHRQLLIYVNIHTFNKIIQSICEMTQTSAYKSKSNKKAFSKVVLFEDERISASHGDGET